MKLTEGEFSHVPAQPHTGLLGILIKHREQLEPGNRITGNAAVQMMALSRAIIEALGGKQVDGRWEVEIGGDAQDVEALAKAISKLDEAQGSIEDKFDEKVKALEARIDKLEHLLAEANAAPAHIATATIDIRDTPAMVELRTMIENLERAVAAQAPRKRSTAKAEEKPSEEV